MRAPAVPRAPLPVGIFLRVCGLERGGDTELPVRRGTGE